MKYIFWTFALSCIGSAQGLWTAASCNYADVNSVINGPRHLANNGDIIRIPAGSCTWASTLIVPSNIGITITGAGTPNTTASTMGASSSCTQTVITDHIGALMQFTPNVLVASRVSCMKLVPNSPYDINPSINIIYAVGSSTVCSTRGCPTFRFDNMTLPSLWAGVGPADNTILVVSNVFGVADHNNCGDSATSAYTDLVNVNHGHWQGIGNSGDNSWATADTFGTVQAFYIENNVLKYSIGTDADTAGVDYGGGRYVCRYNSFSPSEGGCQNHGTDTTSRQRGGRQAEFYKNSWSCPAQDASCATVFNQRSGASIILDNLNTGGDTNANIMFNLSVQRRWRPQQPFGACGGQPNASNFDTTDSTNLGPYSISSIDTTNGIITITTSPWTSGQFGGTFGNPYSMVDTTQTVGGTAPGSPALTINTNAVNSLTVYDLNAGWTPVVGDTIRIQRASVCLDQSTRGRGLLIQNDPPVLQSTGMAGPVNNALDPTYEANDNGAPFNGKGGGDPGMIANRDFFFESINQTAQTSTTSPFNGSSGTGHGTFANMPTSCTPGAGGASGVGYWAQDKQILYTCFSSNTGGCITATGGFWCIYYTPFQYPHPLTLLPLNAVAGVKKHVRSLAILSAGFSSAAHSGTTTAAGTMAK